MSTLPEGGSDISGRVKLTIIRGPTRFPVPHDTGGIIVWLDALPTRSVYRAFSLT